MTLGHSPEFTQLLNETKKDSVPMNVNGKGEQIEGPIGIILGENDLENGEGMKSKYPIPLFFASGQNQGFYGE